MITVRAIKSTTSERGHAPYGKRTDLTACRVVIYNVCRSNYIYLKPYNCKTQTQDAFSQHCTKSIMVAHSNQSTSRQY